MKKYLGGTQDFVAQSVFTQRLSQLSLWDMNSVRLELEKLEAE